MYFPEKFNWTLNMLEHVVAERQVEAIARKRQLTTLNYNSLVNLWISQYDRVNVRPDYLCKFAL